MRSFDYTIKDKVGIDSSPAGLLLKAARQFKSEMYINKGGKSANLTRFMSVMCMGIKKGDTVTVTADGIDEDKAIEEMQKTFEKIL